VPLLIDCVLQQIQLLPIDCVVVSIGVSHTPAMVHEEERRREAIESIITEMVTGPQEQVAPCIRNALEVSNILKEEEEEQDWEEEGKMWR